MSKSTLEAARLMADLVVKEDPSFKGWYRWDRIFQDLNKSIGRNTLYAILKYEKYLDRNNKPIHFRQERLIFRKIEVGFDEPFGKHKIRHRIHTVYFISVYGLSEILSKLGIIRKS